VHATGQQAAVKAVCFGGVGVDAESTTSTAIRAKSEDGTAVVATSDIGYAVDASSNQFIAVRATANDGAAVIAQCQNGYGVYAESSIKAGVYAKSYFSNGVEAVTTEGCAVLATVEKTGTAVKAISNDGRGIHAESTTSDAIYGKSRDKDGITGVSVRGYGVVGISGTYAGFFQGDVYVTGTLRAAHISGYPPATFTQDFEVRAAIDTDPGTVMVMNSDGTLSQSTEVYDKRVAGVVSGAGEVTPAMAPGKQPGKTNQQPIALMGRVHCKVDADLGPIQVGDLLTTSSTPGHAMRATDPARAFGTVIGKAMQSLESGQGLISVLVALR
jgi:hypothetical protein